MANIALTRIVHGKDDGERIVIEEGEKVSGLPNDVVRDLKEAGAIGPESDTTSALEAEKDALEARVAQLEAQLKAEAKQADTEPAPGHPVSGSDPKKDPGAEAKK